MSDQFPPLGSLLREIPVEQTRPRFWTLHTIAELTFIAGFILFCIFI